MNVKDRRGRWFAAPAALAVLVVALLGSASEPQSAIAFTMRKSSHDSIHHNSRRHLGLHGLRH